MTDKQTTMTVMPNKVAKTQQEIFDRAISPVLDKLVSICTKNGIAMQFTAQIEQPDDDLTKIVTEALYTDESNLLFQVIDKLSHGRLNIIELPDGDYYLRTTEAPDDESHDKSVISQLPLVVPFNGVIH